MPNIVYFDNIVPTSERLQLHEFCLKSMYKLGWYDSQDPSKYILNLHSRWSDEDMENSQLLPYIQNCIDQTSWFTKKKLFDVVVNLLLYNRNFFLYHTYTKQPTIKETKSGR